MQFHIRKAAAVLLLIALVLGTVPASAVAVGVLDDPTDTAAPETTAPAKPTAEVPAQEPETGQETGEAATIPAGKGSNEANLFQDALGRDYYVFTQENTRGAVQIYKDFYGGVYFDGPSKHGSFPWMSTAYLQADGNGILYTPGQWVYCIDFDGSTSSGSTTTYEDLSQSPIWQGLSAAKKLGITLALSYGGQYGSHNNLYANIATQTIIWEYQIGGRNTAATYSSNASSPISYASDGNGNYTYCKSQIDAEYSRILAAISNAEAQPAFTESSYTLPNVGTAYAHDFTDSANALSKGVWQVSDCPAELTASIVNGKLRVYANTNFTGEKTITLKRNLYRPSSQAYVCLAGSQWAICGVPDDTTVTVKVSVRQNSTVSLRKTAQASASVSECIRDNPLYSLAGAVYEIHRDSATGPVVEALTTNAAGEAISTQAYPIGTVLYAKEITAPPGYLLSDAVVSLTVKADSSQNVFNVSDRPTFDPEALELTKTGTSGQTIEGAIFKGEFFASTSPSGTALRTWYFASDSNGRVRFDDTHKNLAADAGYSTNDQLFKPYTTTGVQFPLGCVKVTEIKAASGYILPKGSQGTAYIYVRQTTAGGDATAYWGDSDGNPVNTLGMYTITNAAVTAVNEESGTGTMKKALTDGYAGNKAGYSFKLARQGTAPWYGVSDENGDVYLTDESFTAILDNDGSKVYSFENLEDGKFWLVEYLASVGIDDAKPESVHISTSGGRTAAMDVTLSGDQLVMTDDGNCSLFGANGLQLTGLNDGGTLTVEITNTPMAELEIVKTSPNGSVSGVSFTVEQEVSGIWQPLQAEPFVTGASGKINIPELVAGTKLRITEIVPDNYICTTENPQIVTLEQGLNTVTFDNLYIGLTIIKTATDGKIAGVRFEVRKNVDDQWVLLGTYTTNTLGQIAVETEHLAVGAQFKITEIVPDGYFCTSENPRTITLAAGMNYVPFNNTPIGLTIIKTATDGKIDGIEFTVDIKNDANEWDTIGTFETGTDGKINVPREHLIQGATYRITEIVPDNYICTTENPQIVTLDQINTTVNFANKPFSGLEIVKTSRDKHVAGFRFTIEKAVQVGAYTGWQPLDPGTEFYVSDETGKIVIDDDTLLATGMTLRITELEHENYICLSENPQTVTLRIGKNSVNFVNEPVAKLSLVKTCEDGNVDGIQFKLEKKLATEQTGVFAGRERWELIGTYTTHDGGVIAPEDFGLLTVDGIYRVTELVPQGYVCDTPVQTFTAHIGENSVSFKNRQAEGKISVHKEDAEGRPMQGAQFLLEYSMDDGAGWEPIQSRSVKDLVQPGFCTSEGLTDGILSSGADGNVVFTGLALSTASNGNVKYRLTEVKTQNGSTLLGVTVFEGRLPVDDYELSYRVVNETDFQLPHTGGNGFAFTGIAFGFAILAALLILFKLPRKKEDKYN